jgi:hypothetical protein
MQELRHEQDGELLGALQGRMPRSGVGPSVLLPLQTVHNILDFFEQGDEAALTHARAHSFIIKGVSARVLPSLEI